MTTQFNKQKAAFVSNVQGAQKTIDKSHPQLIYAMDCAMDEQELDKVNELRKVVADNMPVLLGRFDDYVIASTENVVKRGTGFDFEDETADIAWSEVAQKSTPWCTKRKLKLPKEEGEFDPRQGINALAAKCLKRKLTAGYKSKDQQAAMREILARCKADLEALAAGTYGAQAQPVEAADGESNVTSITKAA